MGSGFSAKYEINQASGELSSFGQNGVRSFNAEYLNTFFEEDLAENRIEGWSIDKNYVANKEKYPLREYRNLGDYSRKGINNRVTEDPMNEAMSWYKDLAYGGRRNIRTEGDAIYSEFEDGSFVQFRPISSKPNSPVVELNIVKSDYLKTQKIHFQTGEYK